MLENNVLEIVDRQLCTNLSILQEPGEYELKERNKNEDVEYIY